MMRKIREMYLNTNTCSRAKMKVAFAARTLSHTVAACIESMIFTILLPAEAIHIAEFVEDVDSLFDSLNGRAPQTDKPLRRCISSKSRHWTFWEKIEKKISKWVFVSHDGKKKKKLCPLNKDG